MKTFGRIMLVLLVLIGVTVGLFTCRTCSIAGDHVTNSMENAVISYDEYQVIYATCEQLNADLGVIKETPDNDGQFTQFSKSQQINTKKQQLNRWINDYNAKSKHIDKKWWKSVELPHTLTANQFTNY